MGWALHFAYTQEVYDTFFGAWISKPSTKPMSHFTSKETIDNCLLGAAVQHPLVTSLLVGAAVQFSTYAPRYAPKGTNARTNNSNKLARKADLLKDLLMDRLLMDLLMGQALDLMIILISICSWARPLSMWEQAGRQVLLVKWATS